MSIVSEIAVKDGFPEAYTPIHVITTLGRRIFPVRLEPPFTVQYLVASRSGGLVIG
jgi:hypothetical protein